MCSQKQEPLSALQLPGNNPRIPETLLHRVDGVFLSLARLCISSDHSRIVKEHFPFLLCVDTYAELFFFKKWQKPYIVFCILFASCDLLSRLNPASSLKSHKTPTFTRFQNLHIHFPTLVIWVSSHSLLLLIL